MENYPVVAVRQQKTCAKEKIEIDFDFGWVESRCRHGNQAKCPKRKVISFYFHCVIVFDSLGFFMQKFYFVTWKMLRQVSSCFPWSKSHSHVLLCDNLSTNHLRTTIEIDCSYIIRTIKCQRFEWIEREPITIVSKRGDIEIVMDSCSLVYSSYQCHMTRPFNVDRDSTVFIVVSFLNVRDQHI